MGTRKCILVSSVLVIWLISGYSAHSLASGRSAKILEDPQVPQTSSYEVISGGDSKNTALQDSSDRSLSVEHNMMLYRSVFTLSLKLLTVFLVIKLLTTGLTNAGILRPSRPVPIVPFPGGQPNSLYTVDVNHNPGLALSGQGYASGSAYAAGNALSHGSAGVLTATSTGAAAGASTGTAPGILAPVPASAGGYLTAGTNLRPNYLVPGGPPAPRFRFGFGPRHPPFRRPPPMMPVSFHNMGEETHYVDTHSHLFVMPDGSHARVPIGQTAAIQQVKPATLTAPVAAATSNAASASNSQQDSKSSASSTDAKTEERTPVETVNISSSSSSSGAQTAERRSSSVFSQKSNANLQPYDDWNLHFSPGA